MPADARRYIGGMFGGMFGGGRVARTAISTFPRLFDEALCIVGANDFGKA